MATYMSIMEKQTLHEDPSSLEEAFAIFDVKGYRFKRLAAVCALPRAFIYIRKKAS